MHQGSGERTFAHHKKQRQRARRRRDLLIPLGPYDRVKIMQRICISTHLKWLGRSNTLEACNGCVAAHDISVTLAYLHVVAARIFLLRLPLGSEA